MTLKHRPRLDTATEWVRDWGGNSSAVVMGTATTAILTAVLVALPVIAPADPVKDVVFMSTGKWLHDNPYLGLRYLGGTGGGIVAGALSRGSAGYDWGSAVTDGIKAAIYGLVLLYVCYIGALLAVNAFITDVLGLSMLVVFPVILAIPLFVTHLFGGIFGGVVGNAASKVANGERLV